MKKNQDVSAIEIASSLEKKFSAAMKGRVEASGAGDIISDFLNVQNFRLLKGWKKVYGTDGEGNLVAKAPTKAQLSQIVKEHGSLDSYYDGMIARALTRIAEAVVGGLGARNREFFLHLASACGNKNWVQEEQASRIDVLVLLLGFENGADWPHIPVTRHDLEVYLAKHGAGGIDPKTLTAVIRRTGIKLKRGKPGPQIFKRKTSGI